MTNQEAQTALANLKRYMSGGGAVDRVTNKAIDMAIEALGAQPEIIRCKDCKHLFNKNDEGGRCWHFNGFSKDVSYDDFCSYAESGEATA